jgi:hypothetical protein
LQDLTHNIYLINEIFIAEVRTANDKMKFIGIVGYTSVSEADALGTGGYMLNRRPKS